MRVLLHPVPGTPDAVGTLDGVPLVAIGRGLHVGGRPLQPDEIGDALAAAVETAGGALFGSDYLNPLARVLGLNRRSVVSDRVARNGLPGWALHILGYAAGHPAPRALGYLLLGAAELLDADAGEAPAATRRSDLGTLARQGVEDALALVEQARTMKRLPRAE